MVVGLGQEDERGARIIQRRLELHMFRYCTCGLLKHLAIVTLACLDISSILQMWVAKTLSCDMTIS